MSPARGLASGTRADVSDLLIRYPNVNFVIMHICYPFQDEAIALAEELGLNLVHTFCVMVEARRAGKAYV